MCLLSISTLSKYRVYLHCVSGGHFPFPKHSQFSFYFLTAPVCRLQPASAQLYCSDISFLQVGASTYTEAGYLDSGRCRIVKLVLVVSKQ